MKFDKNQNIEELLNGFVDGELSAQEAAEVQQLVEKDPSIARRLHEIETCRMLVSSLPHAEPPAGVVSGIKEVVQGKWSQGIRVGYTQKRSSKFPTTPGHLHLFTRQVLAASIVVGLVGLLGAVIYRILEPQNSTTKIVAEVPEPTVTEPEKAVEAVKAANQASAVVVYSLKLTTADFAGVDSFINKLLDESTWLKFQTAKVQPGQSAYRVYCSRAALEDLMTNLAPVWSRFDSTTLVVHNDNTSEQVAVEQVRPEQVADIAKQETITERVKLARDFAVINGVHRLLPQERMVALGSGISAPEQELITIPKPVLTSGEKSLLTTPKGFSDQVQVNLNIVLSLHK
jgi:hypothetical protein